MAVSGLSLHQGNTESRKNTEQALLVPAESTYPLNNSNCSVATFYNNSFIRSDEGLQLKNVGRWIFLQWLICLIGLVVDNLF